MGHWYLSGSEKKVKELALSKISSEFSNYLTL